MINYPGCVSLAQSTPNDTIPITDHLPLAKLDSIGPPESPEQESRLPCPAQTMFSFMLTLLTPR